MESGVLSSGLSSIPAPDETLSRALFSDNEFNTSGPKHSAFMPAKNNETSVFRQCDADLGLLQATCEAIAKDRGKAVKRVAVTTVGNVSQAGLVVAPVEPPPRHANIVGWPVSADPEREKADRKRIAMVIANGARLVPAP